MKYIRTKDGVYKIYDTHNGASNHWGYKVNEYLTILLDEEDIKNGKSADTIEELCDELVVVQKDFHDLLNADTHCLQTLKRYYEINKIEVLGIYGAIWTEKGLIYVAKMNDKGCLELL